MRKRTYGRIFGLGMSVVVALSAAGCGNARMLSRDLMEDFAAGQGDPEIGKWGEEEDARKDSRIAAEDIGDIGQGAGDVGFGTAAMEPEDIRMGIMDFGLRLLSHSMQEGENPLVSPLSVISALVMTANGARGETLRQMEGVFGASVPELSAYLSAYMENLPEGDKYKLSMANSIWFTEDERFAVEQDFLQTNADLFHAGLYKSPFDASTVGDINRWVDENTDGMIREILNEIPPEAVMYLVNALAFDAEWEDIYPDYQVREGVFTGEDGAVWNAEMMYSSEYRYLEDDSATGFLKYYADRKYAYGALLPDEGVTVSEYVASLTGEKLQDILDHPVDVMVHAFLPKYEGEYGVELAGILREMGMEDAFDAEKADFSGIDHSTAGNLYINNVIHKTFIAVDERGTKAGAATAVAVNDAGAPMEVKTVCLDRPFLYMLIDCDTNLPVFIGVCNQAGK